jgi:hypothetical protein
MQTYMIHLNASNNYNINWKLQLLKTQHVSTYAYYSETDLAELPITYLNLSTLLKYIAVLTATSLGLILQVRKMM